MIATLPDGTIVAVPKDAPTTAEELPTLDMSAFKDAKDNNSIVADSKDKAVTTVSKPQAGVTVVQTASGEKVIYSRVERAKALPQTGDKESLLALLGVGMMSSIGLTGARRKRRG